jgi:hypothetical protein
MVDQMVDRLEVVVLNKANQVNDDDEEDEAPQSATASKLLNWIRPSCQYDFIIFPAIIHIHYTHTLYSTNTL